jgi:hypothetical protein
MDKKSRTFPRFSVRQFAGPAFEIIIEPENFAPAEDIKLFRSKEAAEAWIERKAMKWLARNSKRITG